MSWRFHSRTASRAGELAANGGADAACDVGRLVPCSWLGSVSRRHDVRRRRGLHASLEIEVGSLDVLPQLMA